MKAAYIDLGCIDGASTCVGLTNDVVLGFKTTEDALVSSTLATLNPLTTN